MQRMEERERVGSEREMGSSIADPGIWEEIERSESYLVCSMFEEAASSAASILKRICDDKSAEVGEDNQLHDMMEAAGMVLVQSLKELGRNQRPDVVCLMETRASSNSVVNSLADFGFTASHRVP
ncbi:hypothetical protein L1049_000195 [Liquidambar formosana]|uniref:Uncharacterized protein n=1 Tax=Liquidambar formosana TaxID=63359 RepID=A0AAP0NB06_LIQFO